MLKIILLISPCRSGSTSMLRVFSGAKIPSYFQPLKNSFRWSLMGKVKPWQPEEIYANQIFIKETLGPYFEEEATFNPVDNLIKLGISPQNINLIIMGREPYKTWNSWHKWWGTKTSIEIFKLSYFSVERIANEVSNFGIEPNYLIYELFKEHDPQIVMKRLFSSLDINFHSNCVGNWNSLVPFGEPGSNIFMPDEPKFFEASNAHENVFQANELRFYESQNLLNSKGSQCQSFIHFEDLDVIYERWKSRSQSQLNLTLN